jgi:hypothetical protein
MCARDGKVVRVEVLDGRAGIAGDTWNAARTEAPRNGKSRGRRYGRSFEEKSAGTGHGGVGGAEVVATAAEVVKVHAVEERVPVMVMGVGKGSERACEGSRPHG